jgi:predicted nuclease of predicted toxin-antitoxin system
MQFLANENFALASVRRARAAGLHVASMSEDAPGSKDADVLLRAVREARILLTFDRDYGELIYRLGLAAPAGVVYLRLIPSTPEEPAEQLLRLMAVPGLSLEGRFTVVERGQVRQRPLP